MGTKALCEARNSRDNAVQVNVTTDPDMGTIYSVAVPIKRVKPTARVPMGGEGRLPVADLQAVGLAIYRHRTDRKALSCTNSSCDGRPAGGVS